MLYYPAIPLWSVILIAVVAYAVSVYCFRVEEQYRGHHLWTPVAGGVSRLIAVVFAIIAVWRIVERVAK